MKGAPALYCIRCGKAVDQDFNFCPVCGQALSHSSQDREAAFREAVLFSFGPFFVDISDGPFSVWKWHRRNSFIVELTNFRLCVLPNTRFGLLTVPAAKYPWGVRLPLEIPYASIISVEVNPRPTPIALMHALEVKYHEGGAVRQESIASSSYNIARAYQIISGFMAASQA
jgi:predicted nucleic acid-binding Zn ribbon protein